MIFLQSCQIVWPVVEASRAVAGEGGARSYMLSHSVYPRSRSISDQSGSVLRMHSHIDCASLSASTIMHFNSEWP